MEERNSFLKIPVDFESPNKNIVPVTTCVNNKGELTLGGCSIVDLIDNYGSPLYLLDEASLRYSCKAYKRSLEDYAAISGIDLKNKVVLDIEKATKSSFLSSL